MTYICWRWYKHVAPISSQVRKGESPSLYGISHTHFVSLTKPENTHFEEDTINPLAVKQYSVDETNHVDKLILVAR